MDSFGARGADDHDLISPFRDTSIISNDNPYSPAFSAIIENSYPPFRSGIALKT